MLVCPILGPARLSFLARQAQMSGLLPCSRSVLLAAIPGICTPGAAWSCCWRWLPAFRGWNFLIVGGEPQDVENLRQRVRVIGLKNVILTGFVPNARLPLYQAACDVLLMPYQRQVAASSGGDIARYLSPMKLFEYMACERPIISSDLPVLAGGSERWQRPAAALR